MPLVTVLATGGTIASRSGARRRHRPGRRGRPRGPARPAGRRRGPGPGRRPRRRVPDDAGPGARGGPRRGGRAPGRRGRGRGRSPTGRTPSRRPPSSSTCSTTTRGRSSSPAPSARPTPPTATAPATWPTPSSRPPRRPPAGSACSSASAASSSPPAAPARRTRSPRTPSRTRPGGPLGWVHGADVGVVTAPRRGPALALDAFDPAGVRVDVVPCYPDADATALRACVGAGARGVVLEATGAGNANPAICAAVAELTAAGVVVVTSTRVAAGPVAADLRRRRRGRPAGAPAPCRAGCCARRRHGCCWPRCWAIHRDPDASGRAFARAPADSSLPSRAALLDRPRVAVGIVEEGERGEVLVLRIVPGHHAPVLEVHRTGELDPRGLQVGDRLPDVRDDELVALHRPGRPLRQALPEDDRGGRARRR